jgi:hypothetical protein
MNAQMPLTDDSIRAAFARRAVSADERDLRDRILTATAVVSQRRGWWPRLFEDVRSQHHTAFRLSLVLVLLTMAALIAVLVGSQTNRTTPAPLGGLAYLSGGDLYVAGPGGEAPRLVWDIPPSEDLAPRQLTWVDPETVLLHNYDQPQGTHVVNVTTGARRLLAAGDLVAISPDRRVAAIRTFDQRATPQDRVRFIEIATGTVVGEFPGSIGGYPPMWSPDGRAIVGESMDTIYRVDIASGKVTVLASGLCCGLSPHYPVWSPDGTRVVYVDYHLPVDDTDCDFRCGTLWSVLVVDGEPTRVTPELGSEIVPAFSPDGRWIAYIEQCPCLDARTLGLVLDNLTVIAADGSGARLLAPGPQSLAARGGQFSWDPDSAGITYVTMASTLWHITLGGVATQLEGSAITEFARQVLP